METIEFRHPLRELLWTAGLGFMYKPFDEMCQNGRVFRVCCCSGPEIDTLIRNKNATCTISFLNELLQSLSEHTLNVGLLSHSWYASTSSLSHWEKDEAVLAALRSKKNKDQSLYQYFQSLGLSDGFNYLFLNYLENCGYIEHGCSLRSAWLSEQGLASDV